MRIVHLTTSMGVGGAERLLIAQVAGQLRRGHEVTVWGRGGELDAELPPQAGRIVVPERPAPIDAARLARALRRLAPDVLHAQNPRMTAVAAAARRTIPRARRPPLLATYYGVPARRHRTAARVLRAAERVVCVSHDTAADLRAAGLPAERIAVILSPAPPAAVPSPALRRELAGPRPLVVAAGRLVPQKNHVRLLDAWAAVAPRHPGARLLVVGDGPERGRLEDHAAAIGLDGTLAFAGLRTDAPAIVALADLVVFSSDWEGRAVVALEALAAGVPVVSTPAQGMRELLGRGAGAVATDMSAAALAEALDGALSDPAGLAAMRAAARREAARAGQPAMVAAYDALFRAASQPR